MAQLTSAEMTLVDALFDMYSGSPLNFSNSTFQAFFANDVGIDIYAPRYAVHGDSKGKRLRAFLEIGSAESIAKTLRVLWDVRESIRLGQGAADAVPHARARLDAVIIRLGGRPLPAAFDEPAPAAPPPPKPPKGPSESAQYSLETGFNMLHAMDDAPHARGYAFEGFLRSWFDTWRLEARKSFKIGDGEQIDGSFVHRNSVFLLEAKWKNAATDAGALHAFQGKVGERLEGARGLYVSYAGFTQPSLRDFTAKRILLMDGMDIVEALQRRISLDEIIAAKLRIAIEERRPFVRVRELFP